MAEILKTDIKQFDCAIHLADCHIRLTKRHDEYLQIFENLYKIADASPRNTAIVVAGDVLHSKVDLSPECIRLAADFLKTLSDKRPTILISGNHDCILSNKNRLDSLSPIVEALNHPNLHYLKKSGLYILGNILFNNMSVFDNTESYMLANKIPKTYRNQTDILIGLFHGPVNNALTDIGYTISNRSATADLFDGHDLVFLGDIHRAQTLYIEKEIPSIKLDDVISTGDWIVLQDFIDTVKIRKKLPIIRYPSSIIQQNHGEELYGHGVTVWNLHNRAYKHIEIPNEYGYYTVDVSKGELISDISDMPKKVRLRLRCFETVASEIKTILSNIKKNAEILETAFIRVESEDDNKNIININQLNLNEITSADYQNKLIKEFLTKKNINVVIDNDTFETIFKINKDLNNKLDKDLIVRNIRWRPKRFEFDNMFSYGEGNVIDFTKMKDIIGLFAANRSGKSAILDALSFCLFDKSSRCFKASQVLNIQKMSFKCKFNFEISGVDYFVERKGIADKKGNVKVDVKFWKEENGKITELNGEARRSTNDIIRDYVGTYDDFILTALSIQNNKSGTFIDMGQTERKDLLSQFMGLTIFDFLYKEGLDRLKEISGALKAFNLSYENPEERLKSLEESIVDYTKKYESDTASLNSLTKQRSDINNQIIEENKKLIKLEKEAPKNVNNLEEEKKRIQLLIDDYRLSKSKLELSITEKESHLKIILSQINIYIKQDIVKNHQQYLDVCENVQSQKIALDQKKIVISSMLEKLAKLSVHKFDPNCTFCINNIFYKDALKTKEDIELEKDIVNKLVAKYDETVELKVKSSFIQDEYDKFEELETEKDAIEKDIIQLKNELISFEKKLAITLTNMEEIDKDIEFYYQQKDAIETNKKVNNDVSILNVKLIQIDTDIKAKNSNIVHINAELVSSKKDKDSLTNSIEQIKRLESEQISYQFYCDAVSRDGIPFELISGAVPFIEKEVNSILSQIAEFGISIQTDGKNVITNIIQDGKKWPLELASGMEKFISSIALRIALIEISNLPKPPFMVIDEGFSALDATNMSSLSTLFSVMKTKFDFIIIISHLDVMRDMVDRYLEINKDGNFSKVIYV